MWRILAKIAKNLIYAIPLSMIAGFLFGMSVEPAAYAQLKNDY